MNKYISIISIFIITIGCSSGSSSPSIEEANINNEIAVESETEKLPCELLTESDIKKTLSISEEEHAEVKYVDDTYPFCVYKWKSINFSEPSFVGGKEISINHSTEVIIVVVKNATKKMYEASTKVYKVGQPQEGIGDMAVWGAGNSQLTFLSKGYLIHINVQMSYDDNLNKENAIKLSEIVIGKL